MTNLGTYQTRVVVKHAVFTSATAAGTSGTLNPGFVLSNHGREGADRVTVRSVEFLDLSYGNTTAEGALRLERVALSATQPTWTVGVLPVMAHDTAVPAPAGLTAVTGTVGVTAAEGLNNPLFTPSSNAGSAGLAPPTHGLCGDLRVTEPVLLQNNEGLRITALGYNHSTVNVVAMVKAGAGSYTVQADTDGRGNVMTVMNTTGSAVEVRSVGVTEWPRLTAIAPAYLAAVTESPVRVDQPLTAVRHDTAGAPLPSWVDVGVGHFSLSDPNNWLDPLRVLAAAVTPRHQGNTRGALTSKFDLPAALVLEAGQSLVVYPKFPQQSVGNAGESEIVVQYSVEELATSGGGGEYSYAY